MTVSGWRLLGRGFWARGPRAGRDLLAGVATPAGSHRGRKRVAARARSRAAGATACGGGRDGRGRRAGRGARERPTAWPRARRPEPHSERATPMWQAVSEAAGQSGDSIRRTTGVIVNKAPMSVAIAGEKARTRPPKGDFGVRHA